MAKGPDEATKIWPSGPLKADRPTPPLLPPTGLAAALLLPYGLVLSWDGSVARGTYFAVYRRLPGTAAFTLIAATRDRRFEDRDLPPGTPAADYYIAAVRDESAANGPALNIRLSAEPPAGSAPVTLAA